MKTDLNKEFPNIKSVSVSTGACTGDREIVITLEKGTKIYVRCNLDRVAVRIWEDDRCLWETRVKDKKRKT